jgi:hypothetical protein
MEDYTIAKKTYKVWPEGLYPALIEDIVPEPDGKFGPQLKITFRLLNVPEPDAKLLGWCSQNYSEKSKLFGWCRAALADQFDPNAGFSKLKVIGKQVFLNVQVKHSENGEFNKIADVLRFPNQAMPVPVQPVQPATTMVIEPPPPWND